MAGRCRRVSRWERSRCSSLWDYRSGLGSVGTFALELGGGTFALEVCPVTVALDVCPGTFALDVWPATFALLVGRVTLALVSVNWTFAPVVGLLTCALDENVTTLALVGSAICGVGRIIGGVP